MNIQPTIQQQKTLAANELHSGLPSPQYVCLKIKQTTAFEPERNLYNLNMSIFFCDLLTEIDCSWWKCLNVSRVNFEENFRAGMDG